MHVTRLHCPSCDTGVEGRFAVGRFQQLTPEQLAFAETFIRCEGKINRVEEELGVSYPTVRNRLSELIHALGYPPTDPGVQTSVERQAILSELSAGSITAEQALRRLRGK